MRHKIFTKILNKRHFNLFVINLENLKHFKTRFSIKYKIRPINSCTFFNIQILFKSHKIKLTLMPFPLSNKIDSDMFIILTHFLPININIDRLKLCFRLNNSNFTEENSDLNLFGFGKINSYFYEEFNSLM